MVREQVPKVGLLIDSMKDFRRSISACSARFPSSNEEDEEVLPRSLEFEITLISLP